MPYKDTEFAKKYRADRRKENLLWLRQFKVDAGCADCGYNEHHAGLEFDHTGDKKKNVSAMLHHSRESIVKEISVCEVVCGTCHNIRSFNRRSGVP